MRAATQPPLCPAAQQLALEAWPPAATLDLLLRRAQLLAAHQAGTVTAKQGAAQLG
jgi:hypothetical protein